MGQWNGKAGLFLKQSQGGQFAPVTQLRGFHESYVQRAELQIISKFLHLLLQNGDFDFRMAPVELRDEAVKSGPVDEAVIADGEAHLSVLAGQGLVKKPAITVHHMEKPGLHDFSGFCHDEFLL